MKLLIDVGNTRLKLASLEDDAVRFIAAIDTQNPERLTHELAQHLKRLGRPPELALGVSVHHQQTEQAVETALGQTPLRWVRPSGCAGGVINAYPDPEQLGADRWVGVIGLTRHFKSPRPTVVLASFGTATTVDTLAAEGTFRGGLILPGVSMMHKALAQGTARLPEAQGEVKPYPTDTHTAITSGIAAAQAGAVVRQVHVARQTDRQDPVLCVTGGAWPLVECELRRALPGSQIREMPHVVLDGLAVLAVLAENATGSPGKT